MAATQRKFDVPVLLPADPTTALQAATKQYVDAKYPGHIEGLGMVWVGNSAITITTGSAYIPSLSAVIEVGTAIALTGLSLSASTIYHVYLFVSSGSAAVEVVTTAPAAPYNGTARAKTSDTSRRYIGSVRTDTSSNIMPFDHIPTVGGYNYKTNINNNGLTTLSQGVATTPTTISLSGVIPVTGVRAQLYLENQSTASLAFIGTPDIDPSSVIFNFIRASSRLATFAIMSSTQQINYVLNGTPTVGQGLTVWVLGYVFTR